VALFLVAGVLNDAAVTTDVNTDQNSQEARRTISQTEH